MIKELSTLRPKDIRVAVFYQGDVDEVEHDDYWAAKLDISLDRMIETRCANTVTLFSILFNLYGSQKFEYSSSTKELKNVLETQGNIFIYSLRPSGDEDGEDYSTHTGIIIRENESRYIVVDSYADLYSLRVRVFTPSTFQDNFTDLLNLFLLSPSYRLWYKLTGSKTFKRMNEYTLTVEAFQRDLGISLKKEIRKMYKTSLKKIEGPSKGNKHPKGSDEYEEYEDCRNIYRDDLMSIVLGGYGEDKYNNTIEALK